MISKVHQRFSLIISSDFLVFSFSLKVEVDLFLETSTVHFVTPIIVSIQASFSTEKTVHLTDAIASFVYISNSLSFQSLVANVKIFQAFKIIFIFVNKSSSCL